MFLCEASPFSLWGQCHPEINDILTIWSNMFVRFAFIHLLFDWSFFLSQILCAHLLPLISWHFGRAHHDCTGTQCLSVPLGHLYCPKEEEEGAPNFCSISARSQREDVLDTGQRMKPVCLYYWPHSAFGFFLGEDGTHLLCFFLLRTQGLSRRIEIKWPWKKKNKRTIPASIENTF